MLITWLKKYIYYAKETYPANLEKTQLDTHLCVPITLTNQQSVNIPLELNTA